MSNMIFNGIHMLFLQRNTFIYYNSTMCFYPFKRTHIPALFYFHRRYRNFVSILKANYILKLANFLCLYIIPFFLICQSCLFLYRVSVVCIRNKNYNYNMTHIRNSFHVFTYSVYLALFFKFPGVNSCTFF
jgi:hypothetical protein